MKPRTLFYGLAMTIGLLIRACWHSPGGDFTHQPSAVATVKGTSKYAWGSTDELVADIQRWLHDPATNFGWLLPGDESENRTSKRFDSKVNPDQKDRPTLTV